MRRWLSTVAALAALALLAGCEAKTASYSNASGTLALSRDDALLYAVDTDNELLAIVDTATEVKIAEVKLGKVPERILVGPDDTIYVANRGARSVSVIRRGDWAEATRLSVGVEPVGMAISADGKTLYVVSAASLASAEHGTLTAIDTKTLQTMWDLDVGPEPHGIALVDGNKALVSLYKQGDVVTVDLAAHEVIQRSTELFTRANLSALGLSDPSDPNKPGLDEQAPPPEPGFRPGSSGLSKFNPRGIGDLVVSPDGRKVYGTALWSSQNVLDSRTKALDPGTGGFAPIDPGTGGGGSGAYGGGPCFGGAVATAGVVTFLAEDTTTPKVDDVARCFDEKDKDFPGSVLRAPDNSQPIQGPIAAVIDPTGDWLFVVNHESDNVAVMPTQRRGTQSITGSQPFDAKQMVSPTAAVRDVVRVGSGPSGIALTRDGKRAYVYNSFDHTISTLSADAGRGVANAGKTIVVAQETLTPAVAAGRRLFFSATDSRMNNPATGIACASCHLEGREDGHVWNFAEGPRQTPSLAGRRTGATAPFHWNGEFNTLGDFLAHTVRLRMGGSGATPAMEAQLLAFIDSMEAPDNPHRLAEPSPAQVRGAAVFQKANCQSCHAGESLTNNTFADVGTFVTVGDVKDDRIKLAKGLNTPSLLAVARTGPYLHDGSVATLRDRLVKDQAKNLHGLTAGLSDAELDDLVEYLKSL